MRFLKTRRLDVGDAGFLRIRKVNTVFKRFGLEESAALDGRRLDVGGRQGLALAQ